MLSSIESKDHNEVYATALLRLLRDCEDQSKYPIIRKALKISPENAAANFNLGLLKAELQDFKMAEKYLRAALKADPQLAEAAYNLSILLSKNRLSEAIDWSKKAFELRSDARYGFTFAYYVYQNKELDRAAQILRQLIQQRPTYGDAYLLLGEIYQKQGKIEEALYTYHQALKREGLSEQDRYRLDFQYKSLQKPR